MLGTHGDQCVHARTAPLALAALCHRPHKLPTYATARWRPLIFDVRSRCATSRNFRYQMSTDTLQYAAAPGRHTLRESHCVVAALQLWRTVYLFADTGNLHVLAHTHLQPGVVLSSNAEVVPAVV